MLAEDGLVQAVMMDETTRTEMSQAAQLQKRERYDEVPLERRTWSSPPSTVLRHEDGPVIEKSARNQKRISMTPHTRRARQPSRIFEGALRLPTLIPPTRFFFTREK